MAQKVVGANTVLKYDNQIVVPFLEYLRSVRDNDFFDDVMRAIRNNVLKIRTQQRGGLKKIEQEQ